MFARWNLNLELVGTFFESFRRHLLVGVDSSFVLCLPGSRRHSNPLELVFQCLLSRRGLSLFFFQTSLFLFQPGRVIPLEGIPPTSIKFENPLCDIVEKVSIVRDGNDRAWIG